MIKSKLVTPLSGLFVFLIGACGADAERGDAAIPDAAAMDANRDGATENDASASDAEADSAAMDATRPSDAGNGADATTGADAGGGDAGSPSSPFTFLVYGDSRAGNGCDGNAVHKNLISRMEQEPAAFVVHVGDMVTGYDASTNWVENGNCTSATAPGSFRDLIAPLATRTPSAGLSLFLYPVVGNHDDNWGSKWYPDPFNDGFCSVFDPISFIPNHTQRAYFTARGAPRLSDASFYASACSVTEQSVYPQYMYYSFDYRNSHFVVLRLNSDYYDIEECNNCTDRTNYDDYYYIHQLDWLRADLAAIDRQTTEHVFVFLHAPLVTSSDGHTANVSYRRLANEFTAAGVSIAFSGHNHVYERSHPLSSASPTAAPTRDDLRGTVYTVTGGGGSDLHGFRAADPLIATRSAQHHYLRVAVDGTDISVTAVRTDGTTLDSYTR